MRRKWMASVVLALLVVLAYSVPVLADDGASMVLSEDFVLEAGEVLEEDLVILGGDIRLESSSVLDGDVVVMGGDAHLAGVVEGDVVVFGGTVELAATVVIEGDLVVFGEIRRDPAAVVQGDTVSGMDATKYLRGIPEMLPRISDGRVETPVRQARGWFAETLEMLGTIVGMVVAAFLLYAIAPDHLGRMRAAMTGSWALSGVVGVLTLVLLGMALVILTIICIGIPVALALVLVAVVCVLASWSIAGRMLGKTVLAWFNKSAKSASVEAALGVAILVILSQIPVLGFLLSFLLIAWGLGAAVLTRLGTQDYAGGAPFAGTSKPSSSGADDAEIDVFEADLSTTPKRGSTKPLNPAVLDDLDPNE